MHHPRPALQHLRASHEIISPFLAYNGLTLSISCILLWALRYYALTPLTIRIYGERYTKLEPKKQHSMVNHMVAAISKIVLLITAAYPFASVIANKDLHAPYAPGFKGSLTMGDVLVVVSQAFCAMYIFELIYRIEVSYISAAHHVGAVVIAQSAMVIGFDPAHKSDANIEFVLCLIWGAFDVAAELYPHIAMLIYRQDPTNYQRNAKIMRALAVGEAASTVIETIVVMTLFGSLWQQWTLVFKVVTPILHVLFSVAQLHGARIFWGMYLHFDACHREGQGRMEREEEREGESKV